MNGFINAENFLAEHRGADIFEVITMAYEEGRKDGKSEQLEKVVAELKSLLLDPVKNEPAQDPAKDQAANSGKGDDLLTKTILKKPKAGVHPKAELMKSMAREGKSLQEIMEAAGCSEPTAKKYMKEALDEK